MIFKNYLSISHFQINKIEGNGSIYWEYITDGYTENVFNNENMDKSVLDVLNNIAKIFGYTVKEVEKINK